MIEGLNHFTIAAADRQATLDFYVGLLGLVEGERPDFDFPGAWLYAPGGSAAILHVIWDRRPPAQQAAVIDHVAFSAAGLKAVRQKLDARGWPYDLARLPGAGTWQLFVFDPNGARVELDFDPAEPS